MSVLLGWVWFAALVGSVIYMGVLVVLGTQEITRMVKDWFRS